MTSALTPSEIVLGLMPVIFILSAFFPVKEKSEHGFKDSGHEYKNAESIKLQPLLACRGYWLAFGALAGGAAVWALTEAVASAIQHGTVSLPGTRGHPRPIVSWPAAWAYFCGTTFIAIATVLPRFVRKESHARIWFQLGSALLGTIGYFLVLLSPIFSSLLGVAIFCAAIGAAMAIFYVKRWLTQRAPRQ